MFQKSCCNSCVICKVSMVYWHSVSVKYEVSIVVDEHYGSGEKAVSISGYASFLAPESFTRGKWQEEVMSGMRGVSCNF